ncbi:MAG: hypothetical protein ACR2MU_07085 [Gaiellaceae bacterium]
MRPLTILCALFCLATAAVAGAASTDDGLLAVKGGTGSISLAARGSFIGRCQSDCKIVVLDPDSTDAPPIVRGWDNKINASTIKTIYSGDNVRFRLVDGFYRLLIRGTGIDVSAVGQGTVVLNGNGGFDDGTYSLNAGPWLSLPDQLKSFQLAG